MEGKCFYDDEVEDVPENDYLAKTLKQIANQGSVNTSQKKKKNSVSHNLGLNN